MTNENSPVKQMSTIPSEINWRLRNWPDLCHFFRILPRIITDESWNSFHGEISRISREWEISFRLGGHSLLRLFHPSTGYLSNRQPLSFAVSLLPLSPPPIPFLLRNSSGKSEPQSGASSWLERRIFHRRKSALSPFALRLSSHRSFIPSGSGLENQRTKEDRVGGRGDQLEKLNYLAK